jgi:hypothetical protein
LRVLVGAALMLFATAFVAPQHHSVQNLRVSSCVSSTSVERQPKFDARRGEGE